MVNQVVDHFPFFSLPESLPAGWLICLVIFGLAYYTNPSEKSFKSFLEKFPLSIQRSLPKIDNHSNRGVHRGRGKNHQQQPSKLNTAPRNLKNPSHTLSTSSEVPFPSLSNYPYSRHNLLLFTLISVDRTQHLALNISFEQTDDLDYPQLDWFFGCFDTWFPLRRNTPSTTASFPIFSVPQTLKIIWNQWTWPISDLLLSHKLPTDSSLQDLSLVIKPKRNKSRRAQKSHSLQCEISDRCDRSTECSTSEHSFTSPTSVHESDCYSLQQSILYCESSRPLVIPNPAVKLIYPNGRFNAGPVSMTHMRSTQVALDSVINQISASVNLPNSVVCDSLAGSELELSPDRSLDETSFPPPSGDLCLTQHSTSDAKFESLSSLECGQQLNENQIQSLPANVENKQQEAEVQPSPKVQDETHSRSIPKQLIEPKNLKDLKRAKTLEKQDHSKPSHASIIKQSIKVKAETLHKKSPSINTKHKKDLQQLKKEDDKTKSSSQLSKVEAVKLPKAKDIKVIKKSGSKEKLATHQAESNRKREIILKQGKPHGNPVVIRKVERHSPVQDPGMRQTAPAPHHSFGSLNPSPPPDHIANIPTNLLHAIPMTSIPPTSSLTVPATLETCRSSFLLHDVSSHFPLADPWAPGSWSEAAQQSHIRDSFISLPNLEHRALKDHYPILREVDHAPPSHCISPIPDEDEFFNYQQELTLPSHMISRSEWAFPPVQTSPFGAIGQQGPATSAHPQSSPVLTSSLFRFPGSPAHAPHLVDSTFPVGLNSAKKDNISRTSSSTSLSQAPGYCSTRSSPSLSSYAPIGTPLHPRHSTLNEVCERPGEALSGLNLHYPFNCRPESFDVTEANMIEPGPGHCATLRLNGISQSLLQHDPTVSSPVRNTVEGFSPIKVMETPTFGISRHHTTQSLNGTPQPATKALNSIFDDVSDKIFPVPDCSLKPKGSGFGLNPSAKVFAFGGGSKSSPSQSPCPPAYSVDRQRARGYSQSTISTCPEFGIQKLAHSPHLLNKHQAGRDNSKNLLKSLHRSSWSVLLDFKGAGASVHDLESKSNLGNRIGVLSELSMHASSEKGLPAGRSNSACAGLFGSIGDMKARKTSAPSSASVSPIAPSSVLEQPFGASLQS